MMKRFLACCLTLTLVFSALAGAFATEAAEASVTDLRTQRRLDPVGVDEEHPAFSWRMESNVTGAVQTAYRIEVWDEQEEIVWDSGRVESPESLGILYEGAELKPSTRYTWQVTVTDQTGRELVSDRASFVTSLLSGSFDAWEGAKWIGAPELPLDAASKAVFRISADVTLQEGSRTASFILGANDFRLMNAAYNPGLMEGENWVRVELDLSDATPEGGAKINVYRMGYAAGEDEKVPFAVIADNADLDGVLHAGNMYETHRMEIFCTASTLTMTVDGTELKGNTVTVNPWGTSNTYPNLNGIGFAMNPGETAVFDHYTVENAGRFARGTVLKEEALPELLAGSGIEVDGTKMTVGGGEGGLMIWTDPSHDGAPVLRKQFELAEEAEKAWLYVTVQGICNLSLNGQEIAPEEWFNPGSTEYDAILGYSMYDVTDALRQGENTLEAVLGEGWWTGMATFECLNNNYYGDQPALMARLVITGKDGQVQTLVTDESWQCRTDGPVRLASLFQGERYDATLEEAEGEWTQAARVETRKPFTSPKLTVRSDDPVHVIREIRAAECLGEAREGSGAWIYDMGENLVGVPEIRIPAEYARAGERLTIRYAEILYPALEEYTTQGVSGLLMVENLRTAMATDFYTMKEGEQTFCPDLTFHGYRYIEITGPEKPLPADCVGMKVLSSLEPTVTYESSNELTNRLMANIVNSTTGNYLSIPTDCPQRDERMGWTGDAQVYALSASYVADTYNFMRQWMDTVRADCGPTGLSSQYCPAFVQYDPDNDESILHQGQSFGITWNCLVVTIPYNLYLQTGDRAIVKDNLENICTYVDHLCDTPLKYKDANKKRQEEPRLTGETGTLCDHLARIPTDGVSLGNAVFIACLDEAAVLCDAAGETEKAETYRQKAAEARTAWNELFIDPETGKTKNAKGVIQDTQASYATPLRFGVISEENLPLALAHYARTIESPEITDSDGLAVPPYTITTGFNATGNVLNALTMNGRSDLAYRMFESTDYASWLYPVTQGATSIWERWNGYTNELGFNGNNGMNSFNHYSFGAVCEWIMAYQLGICTDPEAPGYRHFLLQPTPGGSFTRAGGSYTSDYGVIRSAWTAEEGKMTGYDVTVPANTGATLYLPFRGSLTLCEGITGAGETVRNGLEVTVLELAAGSYHFDIGAEEAAVTVR